MASEKECLSTLYSSHSADLFYCGQKILQCCPVFVPQIIGLPVFPPEVTEKASSLQSPTDPSLVFVISTLYGPAISNF